jgi:hypothetical protein
MSWRRDRTALIDRERVTHVRMNRTDAVWFSVRAKKKRITSAEYFSRLKTYCEKSMSKGVNVSS